MPHTSHRKKKQSVAKRVQVIGEDGWTRVTTTNHSQQYPNHPARSGTSTSEDTGKTVPEQGATVQSLQEEYEKIEKRWQASDACKVLTSLLKGQVLSDGRQIDGCIVFGSASFCGLRKGWISMKTAALTQLAALKGMQNAIEEATGRSVPAYAQEPAYNDVDTEFLETLGVEAVQHPRGFELLTSKSLAYTPTAELHVELHTLDANPGIRLGSKLDFYWRNERGLACTNRVLVQQAEEVQKTEEIVTGADNPEQRRGITGLFQTIEEECRCFEAFLRDRQEASVPHFEVKDTSPFRDQHLYWLRASEDEATT